MRFSGIERIKNFKGGSIVWEAVAAAGAVFGRRSSREFFPGRKKRLRNDAFSVRRRVETRLDSARRSIRIDIDWVECDRLGLSVDAKLTTLSIGELFGA